MRLLLLSTYFPNSDDPIRGTFNLQQAVALHRHCELRVVAPTQWFPLRLWHGAGPDRVSGRETIEGLVTWHPRYVLTPGILRDTYAFQMGASLLPSLFAIREEYPFDVLLATWAFPDVVVGAAAARLFGVPLLAKVHGSDINVQTRFGLRRRQIRWALGQAHRVFAVSEALRERLLLLGIPPEKVVVTHNGVDGDRFRTIDRRVARAAVGVELEGRHVVFVGYLVDSKAVDVLLDALQRLRAGGRLDFTTHLVGAGPLAPSLRRRAAELGLGEAVRFHGARPHEEIPAWMGAADLFCLPSIREGCPNVLLEALSSGRPVVATKVGGVPEILSPESGILVPPSDPGSLAEGLRRGLDREWDPAALRASVARFSWDRGAQSIYTAAREAVAEREAIRARSVPGLGRRARG